MKKTENDEVKSQVTGALIALGVKQERPNPLTKFFIKKVNGK